MINIRLHFSKTFGARYISHLDLARCFARAIKMSGLNVWYTEGFNPHIFMTFALPLSLGYESICEIVDIRLLGDTIDPYVKDKINAGLPAGIEVFNVTQAAQNPTDIMWARYFVELSDGVPPEELCAAADALMAQPQLLTVKNTKKGGQKEVDIKPMIGQYEASVRGDACFLDLILAAGNQQSINPALLLDLLFEKAGKTPAHQLIKRVQILDKSLRNFE